MSLRNTVGEREDVAMEATMTPRDIQLKIRSGVPLADVIAASGMPPARVEAFAGPILAEREHTTAMALSAQIRRRGETASSRRLHQTIAEALLEQGQDIDLVAWDSWRRSDGRWILQGGWEFRGKDLCARFVFDPKGRFSIADNDTARVLIGDLPLSPGRDPSQEPTLNPPARTWLVQEDLSQEITIDVMNPEEDTLSAEDSLRSDIDLLYDMISTIDEDSVRIFRGLREPLAPLDSDPAPKPLPRPSLEPSVRPSLEPSAQPPAATTPEPLPELTLLDDPSADDGWSDPGADPAPARHAARKRARVPAWDDIIFGGRS